MRQAQSEHGDTEMHEFCPAQKNMEIHKLCPALNNYAMNNITLNPWQTEPPSTSRCQMECIYGTLSIK